MPPGLGGIDHTLNQMRSLTDRYKSDPVIYQLSRNLVRDLPQKDYHSEINSIFSFVQNNIRYTRDINGVETVQTPAKTLEVEQGDCDDKSTLLAALLESVGFKTRFHAMGFRKNHINHVLLEVYIDNEWLALDATEPQLMGWKPPGIVTSKYR